jgi:hypothetical protein
MCTESRRDDGGDSPKTVVLLRNDACKDSKAAAPCEKRVARLDKNTAQGYDFCIQEVTSYIAS